MGIAERREREKADRRAAIVDAAEAVFIEKGLDAATMDDIAARAELSKGALYLHFRSKDELYLEVAQRHMSACFEVAGAAAGDEPTGLAEIANLARAFIDAARARGDSMRVPLAWLLAQSPIDETSESFAAYRALIGTHSSRLFGAIERGQRDGSIRSDATVNELGMWVWGSTIGLVLLELNREAVNARLPRERHSRGDLGALHVGAVTRALAAGPPCPGPTPSPSDHES